MIYAPKIKEYIIESNSLYKKAPNKKPSLKNITIIGDIKEFFPEDITRDKIKDLVYNNLNNLLIKDNSEFIIKL